MNPISGTLETVLYAADVRAAAAFYTDILGFTVASDMDTLSVALRVSPNQVLLIFNPKESSVPGRVVPSHGATGPGHAAFLIHPADYDDWLARLQGAGVDIEQEQTWRDGHRSIYVRDPAGNSVELITADIWNRG